MNIYIDSKFVVFESSGKQIKRLTGHLKNVFVKMLGMQNEEPWIEVICLRDAPIKFPYSKVETPSSANATELKGIIEAYNLANGRSLIFTAEPDQTEFFAQFNLPNVFSAFINGSLNTNMFSTSENVITYSGPAFYGGEEVVINI